LGDCIAASISLLDVLGGLHPHGLILVGRMHLETYPFFMIFQFI
jgi:hypothetical protein